MKKKIVFPRLPLRDTYEYVHYVHEAYEVDKIDDHMVRKTNIFKSSAFSPKIIVPIDGSSVRKIYSPLVDEPFLHRTFAFLDEEKPEEILNFANKYGLLGFPEEIIGKMKSQPRFGGAIRYKGKYGELLDHWKEEILSMRGFLKVLDAVKIGDYAALKEYGLDKEIDKILSSHG